MDYGEYDDQGPSKAEKIDSIIKDAEDVVVSNFENGITQIVTGEDIKSLEDYIRAQVKYPIEYGIGRSVNEGEFITMWENFKADINDLDQGLAEGDFVDRKIGTIYKGLRLIGKSDYHVDDGTRDLPTDVYTRSAETDKLLSKHRGMVDFYERVMNESAEEVSLADFLNILKDGIKDNRLLSQVEGVFNGPNRSQAIEILLNALSNIREEVRTLGDGFNQMPQSDKENLLGELASKYTFKSPLYSNVNNGLNMLDIGIIQQGLYFYFSGIYNGNVARNSSKAEDEAYYDALKIIHKTARDSLDNLRRQMEDSEVGFLQDNIDLLSKMARFKKILEIIYAQGTPFTLI